MKTTLARMRQLIGTTADWLAQDLVIGDGEVAVERAGMLIKLKVGDGVKRYSALPFVTTSQTSIPPEYLTQTEGDARFLKLVDVASTASPNKVPRMGPSGLLARSMIPAVASSAGPADAGKIGALSSTGRFHPSLVTVTTGGYKGTADATAPVPAGTFKAGDYFINTTAGLVHASWGMPGGTAVSVGAQMIWDGARWQTVVGSGETVPDTNVATLLPFPGAVPRTQNDVNADHINAAGLGASPGASAAVNTAAIQAAIDALFNSGRRGFVHLSAGTYAVSATASTELFMSGSSTTTPAPANTQTCLILRSGVTLVGEGPATLIQSVDPSKSLVTLVSVDGSGIVNMRLDGGWDGVNGVGHGIYLSIFNAGDFNKNLVFEKLEIANCGSYGIGAQWGNYQNNRYDKLYIHDTGADAIDHKVAGAPVGQTATSRGVSFSNILCERYGRRAGIVGSAGLDIRGPATVVNYMARNFSMPGKTTVGIRFNAGIHATGPGEISSREPSSYSVLDNFYIEGDLDNPTIGVVVQSARGVGVSNGVVRHTTDSGIFVTSAVVSGYELSRDVRVSNVLVEGVWSGKAFVAASATDSIQFIGCIGRGDTNDFNQTKGNLIAGQTVFAARYDAATVKVYKNAILLTAGADYAAPDGASVTLTVPVLATDVVSVVTPNAIGFDIDGLNCSVISSAAPETTAPLSVASAANATLRLSSNSFGFPGLRSNEISAAPSLEAYGAAANIGLSILAKGTGTIDLRTNGGARALNVSAPVNGANFLQVIGAIAGGTVLLNPAGSDANIPMRISSKGTAEIELRVNASRALNISNPVAAVNWFTVTGGAAGIGPGLFANGSDTDVDVRLVPKNAGVVRFGTLTANADAPVTGYITIKDASGVLRKLAVIA